MFKVKKMILLLMIPPVATAALVWFVYFMQ